MSKHMPKKRGEEFIEYLEYLMDLNPTYRNGKKEFQVMKKVLKNCGYWKNRERGKPDPRTLGVWKGVLPDDEKRKR